MYVCICVYTSIAILEYCITRARAHTHTHTHTHTHISKAQKSTFDYIHILYILLVNVYMVTELITCNSNDTLNEINEILTFLSNDDN